MSRARRILSDPLTLFLALGAGCFVLWSLATEEARDTIVVTPQVVASLEADFRVLEGRPADAEDRAALIDRFVEDRVLFHEALDRGLHLGDPKTEHRLVDKLRFLLAETPPAPTEAQLRGFYVEHAADYTTEWRLSFEHRYFADADRAPSAPSADGPVPEGDDFMFGDRFVDYHASMIRAIFGADFADVLLEAEAGRWIGPLSTVRGTHLVRLVERTPPRVLPFDAARDQVTADWMAAQQRAGLDARVAELRRAYRIVVEDV